MRDERELRDELHRLSTALTSRGAVELTTYERRELEGAAYAIAWALGRNELPPVSFIAGHERAQRAGELAAARLADAARPTPAPAARYDGYGSPGFLDRSQPRDRDL